MCSRCSSYIVLLTGGVLRGALDAWCRIVCMARGVCCQHLVSWVCSAWVYLVQAMTRLPAGEVTAQRGSPVVLHNSLGLWQSCLLLCDTEVLTRHPVQCNTRHFV
jgi:hypothetical protein